MNKIFKVIWSKTAGRLVVVSELSKSEGKATSQTDQRGDVCGNIQGGGKL